MALCRVFSEVDGTVRIMSPNPRCIEGMTPKECSAFCDEETKKNPSLVGLPFIDIEKSFSWRNDLVY